MNNDTCPWTREHDHWETGCGEAFEFTTDGPEENGFSFCPYCGKRCVEIWDDVAREQPF